MKYKTTTLAILAILIFALGCAISPAQAQGIQNHSKADITSLKQAEDEIKAIRKDMLSRHKQEREQLKKQTDELKARRAAYIQQKKLLSAEAPNMLIALQEARKVLETALQYFPKSIKNTDRFRLLNTIANSVDPAINKATGKT